MSKPTWEQAESDAQFSPNAAEAAARAQKEAVGAWTGGGAEGDAGARVGGLASSCAEHGRGGGGPRRGGGGPPPWPRRRGGGGPPPPWPRRGAPRASGASAGP